MYIVVIRLLVYQVTHVPIYMCVAPDQYNQELQSYSLQSVQVDRCEFKGFIYYCSLLPVYKVSPMHLRMYFVEQTSLMDPRNCGVKRKGIVLLGIVQYINQYSFPNYKGFLCIFIHN